MPTVKRRLVLAVALAVGTACAAQKPRDPAPTAAGVTQAAPGNAQPTLDENARTMQAGLTALYETHDYTEAVARFREVLGRSPTHYGATFQLARALDGAGRPDEARGYWVKALAMAEGYQDQETMKIARDRLAQAK